MHGELFDSTIPFGEPELLKTTAYRRYLEELDADPLTQARIAHLSQLSLSLQADLGRFEQPSGVTETVEALAACVRHSSDVTIHLQCADRVLPLTVFPQRRLLYCPMDMGELIERHLPRLQVMDIEPAQRRPPGDEAHQLVGDIRLYHPLTPFLWALAMRGPRRTLLPEIAGPAVYRVSPAIDIPSLALSSALRSAVERLRRQATSLGGIAGWPAFDRERACRLLNALYLQAGLIVSRSHPDAVREGWF